jgi:hypothetical protein
MTYLVLALVNLVFAAANLPGALDGNDLSIAAAGFCSGAGCAQLGLAIASRVAS